MSDAQPAPGLRLKAERERRGLSAQKAADEMHLDAWVVQALEAGDYPSIGPAVYAKGHLKKYATMLGLPAAEIMAGFDSAPKSPAAAAAPSLLLAQREASETSVGVTRLQVLGGTAVALVVVGVLWWRPWQPRRAAPEVTVDAAPGPQTAAPEPDLAPIPTLSAPAVANVPAATSSTAVAPATLDAGTANLPGAGRARLRLSFSADSWVDVRDASGKRTYAGNGLANSVKTIAGTAPMHVYLGFGNGVQLQINDRVVAIGPQFFAGDAARFEAGADGVLRREVRGEPLRNEAARGEATRGEAARSASSRGPRPIG